MVWLFPKRQLVFTVPLLFFDESLRRFSVTERTVIYYPPLFAIQLTIVTYMLIAQIGFMKKQFIYFIWLCGRHNNGHPKKTTQRRPRTLEPVNMLPYKAKGIQEIS